jgi:hypothetical protein
VNAALCPFCAASLAAFALVSAALVTACGEPAVPSNVGAPTASASAPQTTEPPKASADPAPPASTGAPTPPDSGRTAVPAYGMPPQQLPQPLPRNVIPLYGGAPP